MNNCGKAVDVLLFISACGLFLRRGVGLVEEESLCIGWETGSRFVVHMSSFRIGLVVGRVSLRARWWG